MIKLYGIPNCDTVRKIRKDLESQKVDFDFINFKKDPPTEKFLRRCFKHLGDWPINKRGTTYRKLKAEFENSTEEELIELMIDHPSVIKRPLIEEAGKIRLP